MRIYICIHSGLCSGAQVAYDAAVANANENLYMYGDVLHNPEVMASLKAKGARVIKSVNEVKYLENKQDINVLIRAHGVPKSVIDELEESNIHYLDQTCIEVKKIHNIVYDMSRQNYKIIIIGDKAHAEIRGTLGWVVNEPIVLANLEEVQTVVPELDNESTRYCVVAQTTYNHANYLAIKEFCMNCLKDVVYYDTVCSDTENRQIELAKYSREADSVIVIGGKNSSNSNKLYEIAAEHCKNVQFIESYRELDFSAIKEDSYIVISSGASTPDALIRKVTDCLHNFHHDMTSPLI